MARCGASWLLVFSCGYAAMKAMRPGSWTERVTRMIQILAAKPRSLAFTNRSQAFMVPTKVFSHLHSSFHRALRPSATAGSAAEGLAWRRDEKKNAMVDGFGLYAVLVRKWHPHSQRITMLCRRALAGQLSPSCCSLSSCTTLQALTTALRHRGWLSKYEISRTVRVFHGAHRNEHGTVEPICSLLWRQCQHDQSRKRRCV